MASGKCGNDYFPMTRVAWAIKALPLLLWLVGLLLPLANLWEGVGYFEARGYDVTGGIVPILAGVMEGDLSALLFLPGPLSSILLVIGTVLLFVHRYRAAAVCGVVAAVSAVGFGILASSVEVVGAIGRVEEWLVGAWVLMASFAALAAVGVWYGLRSSEQPPPDRPFSEPLG